MKLSIIDNTAKYYIIENKTIVGLIGTINDNLIFNLLQEYHSYKIINKIFDKFIKTLKTDILYANLKSINPIFTQLGFVHHKQTIYKYHVKYHNILHYKYPHVKYFTTINTIKERLLDLKAYEPVMKYGNKNIINVKNINIGLSLNFDKERNMNMITDYFTDKCRNICVFKKFLSPYDYYIKHKGEIVLQSLTNDKFDIDKFENVMYNKPEMKFCNNFQVSMAVSIYKLFGAKKIFDSSAGWGDRLIASIALNLEYIGIDPSRCLKPLYKKIINTLGSSKQSIQNIGIEQVIVKDIGETCDLCFSSPPFYDLEVYDNSNEGQSIIGYKTQLDWEKSFLTVLVEQNIKVLKLYGYLVLYIPENYYIIEYLNKHKQLCNRGIISFYTPKRRKIFVWQKTKNN
jgi:hypothetical protein